jgi:hypothetical protein
MDALSDVKSVLVKVRAQERRAVNDIKKMKKNNRIL